MQHCLGFYSKNFKSSHCKHFFHEVSSRNEGTPTTLIPTGINQTVAHCNPQTTCATVFLLDGLSKNRHHLFLHPHPVDQNTRVRQLPSPKDDKKSHARTAAAPIEPATSIIKGW